MRRPGIQNERGTQLGASLTIPFPCSNALLMIEFSAIVSPVKYIVILFFVRNRKSFGTKKYSWKLFFA
jgi:hypothetical protein